MAQKKGMDWLYINYALLNKLTISDKYPNLTLMKCYQVSEGQNGLQ